MTIIASLARSAIRVAVVTLALLLVPVAAMLFTVEVNWGIEDFSIAGILLFVAGMAYSILARRLQSTEQRVAVAAVILLALGAVWAQLAVGLFT